MFSKCKFLETMSPCRLSVIFGVFEMAAKMATLQKIRLHVFLFILKLLKRAGYYLYKLLTLFSAKFDCK